MSIIEVNQVFKRYRLGQIHGLRQTLKRIVGREPAHQQNNLMALNGVDFKVDAGEVVGIIGTNGAGKSTLLKVLSGITTPTKGTMIARGRIAPLIEVGAGLIADLTGRENIYLNGVILGMSVREIRQKFDDIVAFAELEKFIDTPIKRYSSGMAVRLGFAIATAVDCEILIVDEVLAVGDIAFQRKCFDRIEDIIRKQRKTILLVSHNIRQVERLCTRALLLDQGQILMDGAPKDVCQQFYERTNAKVKATISASAGADVAPAQWPDVEMISVHVVDSAGGATDIVPFRKDIPVEIRFRTTANLRRVIFGLGVHTSDMLYLATHQSESQLHIVTLEKGEHLIRCVLRGLPLVPGVYSLRFGITDGDGTTQAYYGENLAHFQIVVTSLTDEPPPLGDGFFAADAEWTSPEYHDHASPRLAVA